MDNEKMSIGKARAIFDDIYRPGLTDAERMEAIRIVLDMETHNSITKASMLRVMRLLWQIANTKGGSDDRDNGRRQ